MDAYRVSESEADWPALIERAAAGEPVVITRDGKPIAELHAPTVAETPKHLSPEAQEALHRLDDLRRSLPPSTISSVELLNGMYDETPW